MAIGTNKFTGVRHQRRGKKNIYSVIINDIPLSPLYRSYENAKGRLDFEIKWRKRRSNLIKLLIGASIVLAIIVLIAPYH